MTPPACDPFFAPASQLPATAEDWRRFSDQWRRLFHPRIVDQVERRREAVEARAARGRGTPAYLSVDEPAAPVPRQAVPEPLAVVPDLERFRESILRDVAELIRLTLGEGRGKEVGR